MEEFGATRAALEPLIKKPQLSDKLLGKPPFKFLFDVVRAVLAAKPGYGAGLFTDQELAADVQEWVFIDRQIRNLTYRSAG
jgi:hypothetical protein